MSAIRAATAGSRTLRSDVKDPRVFARDLFDAAARHRTELVHTPFYGVRCVTVQTPAPTGSIHAKGGRATWAGAAALASYIANYSKQAGDGGVRGEGWHPNWHPTP